jgi:ATP-dependent Clp protease ATP-binding subunit ClpX
MNNHQKAIQTPAPRMEQTTPKEIKAHLDDYVIGQDAAKKTLAVAVHNHYKRMSNFADTVSHFMDVTVEKSNILMVGPTGCGKTHIGRTMAQKLGVPFVEANSTSLTEAGFVGEDVESIIERLIDAADGDLERAQSGIVYIDEIDKLRRQMEPSPGKDVSGEGVQHALLKLIEGSKVLVKKPNSSPQSREQVEFDTSGVLFLCSGAFAGIETIIANRLGGKEESTGSKIGFTADLESKTEEPTPDANILSQVTTEDLVNYGIIPELVGRLPVIATLDALDEEAWLIF